MPLLLLVSSWLFPNSIESLIIPQLADSTSMDNTNATATTTAKQAEWRWPVPLLFGGVTTLMALVALALLILACSYWKTMDSQSNGQSLNASAELGVQTEISGEDFEEEKVVVIMAGQQNPTFLARPASGSYLDLEAVKI
jgi:hypothetical protein